jgi:hypothetical protein
MRAQFGAIFDDDAGLAGEVSTHAPWERVISGRYVLAGGETGPFRRRWEDRRPILGEALAGEVVRPIRELEQESQNGNSG